MMHTSGGFCAKVAYCSRAAAKAARKKGDRARRAYKCDCGYWHLTSQDAGLRAQYKDIESRETAA